MCKINERKNITNPPSHKVKDKIRRKTKDPARRGAAVITPRAEIHDTVLYFTQLKSAGDKSQHKLKQQHTQRTLNKRNSATPTLRNTHTSSSHKATIRGQSPCLTLTRSLNLKCQNAKNGLIRFTAGGSHARDASALFGVGGELSHSHTARGDAGCA